MALSHKQSSQATAAASLGEKTLRDSGSGAIAFSHTATSQTKIVGVRLGTTTAATSAGDLTLVISNPTLGAAFACTVLSTTMVGNDSIAYSEALYLEKGDVFTATYANPDSVSYGLSVVYADLEVN
jgi:hypothetical protein